MEKKENIVNIKQFTAISSVNCSVLRRLSIHETPLCVFKEVLCDDLKMKEKNDLEHILRYALSVANKKSKIVLVNTENNRNTHIFAHYAP